MRLIIDEQTFKVYYDSGTEEYYAVEDNYITPVEPVLKIKYDVIADTHIDVEIGYADYMGEQVTDENIIFWGFNAIDDPEFIGD